MAVNAPTLCKDCRHARLSFASDDYDLSICENPRGFVDHMRLTDGKTVRVYKDGAQYCEVSRAHGPCGKDAAWFEPIEEKVAV